jgi:hypothetical protein
MIHFYRGVVLLPKSLDMDFGTFQTFGYRTGLIGHHVYLGKNRWLLPNGNISYGQKFHRKMVQEYSCGYWQVV